MASGAGAAAAAAEPHISNVGSGTFDYKGQSIEIRDVWAHNLDVEMAKIRELVDRYPYVAMDTEFPGVVARPMGSFTSNSQYHYQTLRCNVDLLKIIQLGITFCNERGEVAEGCPTWQFNFQFSLSRDIFAQDSIDLLTRSGIDFAQHEAHGIDVQRFGELMMTSGLVLSDEVKWISFHSGYDFGYLLKVLTCSPLPAKEASFFELLHAFFPAIYDEKHLMTATDSLVGGLNKLASDLGVDRVGPMHQAGSDSLLTAATFFRMRDVHFGGSFESRHVGVLYGLGDGAAS